MRRRAAHGRAARRTELTKVSGVLDLLTKTAGVFSTVTEGPTQSISMSPEPSLKAVSLKMQPPPAMESEKPGPARAGCLSRGAGVVPGGPRARPAARL